MGVSRLHLTAWNWFIKELIVIELVGFCRRKWNAEVCHRVYKNPTITDPCSESGKSNPHIPTLFIQDQYYIILPSTSRFSKWSLIFTFSIQNVVFVSHIFHSYCMSHACHLLHHLTARVICGEEHNFLQLIVHVSPDSRIHGYRRVFFSPEYYFFVGHIFCE